MPNIRKRPEGFHMGPKKVLRVSKGPKSPEGYQEGCQKGPKSFQKITLLCAASSSYCDA